MYVTELDRRMHRTVTAEVLTDGAMFT